MKLTTKQSLWLIIGLFLVSLLISAPVLAQAGAGDDLPPIELTDIEQFLNSINWGFWAVVISTVVGIAVYLTRRDTKQVAARIDAVQHNPTLITPLENAYNGLPQDIRDLTRSWLETVDKMSDLLYRSIAPETLQQIQAWMPVITEIRETIEEVTDEEELAKKETTKETLTDKAGVPVPANPPQEVDLHSQGKWNFPGGMIPENNLPGPSFTFPTDPFRSDTDG